MRGESEAFLAHVTILLDGNNSNWRRERGKQRNALRSFWILFFTALTLVEWAMGLWEMVYGMIVMDDLSAKFNFLSFSLFLLLPLLLLRLLRSGLKPLEVDESLASKLAVVWIEI